MAGQAMIFVFGSNLGGHHGRGAALTAKLKHGAIMGQGVGLQGSSYAIPTKPHNLRISLSIDEIRSYVDDFIDFAKANQEMKFQVTRIGCGLAGYQNAQIAPLFKESPTFNVFFDEKWSKHLGRWFEYWGTE
jgi:hypothetical protein